MTDAYQPISCDFLNTGETLRLDQLIEVGQAKLADY